MLRKNFSISESQRKYLQSSIHSVKSTGGKLSESGIVRVALELLMELPIDFHVVRDEDGLRREGLKLIRLAHDAFETLKIQLGELDYQDHITDNVPDAVYMVNESGNFTLINRVAQKRMGYTRQDLIGKHFSQIVAPEYKDVLSAYLQSGISGEESPGKYTVEIIAKNKERFPVELNITRLKDKGGAIVAVFGIAREILPEQM